MSQVQIIPGSLRDRLVREARGAAEQLRSNRDEYLRQARAARRLIGPQLCRQDLRRARAANRALIGARREIAKLEGRA